MVQVVSCTSTSCQINVPVDPDYTYYKILRDVESGYGALTPDEWNERAASNFLTQASFGPTRATIGNLSTQVRQDEASTGRRLTAMTSAPPPSPPAYIQWILDQMAVEPTLHRAYVRKRVNPRLSEKSEAGRSRGACEVGSRWNSIAIRGEDIGKTITFSAHGSVTAVYVNNVLRSEIDLAVARPYGLDVPHAQAGKGQLALDYTYTVCKVREYRLGQVIVGDSCTGALGNEANTPVDFRNFDITFTALSYPTIDSNGLAIEVMDLATSDATFHTFSATSYNGGAMLLSAWHVTCTFSLGAQVRPATAIKYGGQYYRNDPRLVLAENTDDAPASLSTASVSTLSAPAALRCSSVDKNFLNEDSCVITQGCSSKDPTAGVPLYAGTTFTLDDATVRLMYTEGNNFAYYITNLAVTGTPCDSSNRSPRFRSLGSACSDHGGETSLAAATMTLFQDKIRSSSGTGGTSSPRANSIVKDIQMDYFDLEANGGACNVATCTPTCNIPCLTVNLCTGTKVEVDGVCWQHVHPDEYKVYDFTLWATSGGNDVHKGNIEDIGYFPIKQPAYGGSAALVFPHSGGNSALNPHDGQTPLTRWETAFSVKDYFVGTLGDSITFDELPASVQTAGLAAALGVSADANTVTSGVPGVGGWGGTCTCPDGNVYQVGDTGACTARCDDPVTCDTSAQSTSLACYGGIQGTCNTYSGGNPGGATKSVICAPDLLATTEVCGSPGETSNDPIEGSHFWYGSKRSDNVGPYNQHDLLQNHRTSGRQGPAQIAHSMAAIYAPDELRQRVSWSLAELLIVAVQGSAILDDNTEVWTRYYDIFVRHAFGKYRDILKEGARPSF